MSINSLSEKDPSVDDVIDVYGEKTLKVIGAAEDFNQWMFQTIRPYCEGETLEIGSGIGNISEFFFKNNIPIHCSDFNPDYFRKLEKMALSEPMIKGVWNVDLVHPDFEAIYQMLLGKFQTIFALNVIEHIENEHLAIANCKKLLQTNGNLIILVPAYQFLFNDFDKSLGHYRRYNRSSSKRLLQSLQFRILHQQYFNAFGILGWVWSGTIRKRKYIPLWQMKVFNFILPLAKFLDVLLLKKLGLSVITVGKKSKSDFK